MDAVTGPSILGPTSAAPRKSLGQHFLVDQGALRRVLAAADIRASDVVVEVGPGTGLLTKLLAETGAKVTAVELDNHLAASLKIELSGFPNVAVIHDDAREWDSSVVGAPYKVVANLPYYAATPIVRRFLESPQPPSLMVVTVQREVAQSYGCLSRQNEAVVGGRATIWKAAHRGLHKPRILPTGPKGHFGHCQD